MTESDENGTYRVVVNDEEQYSIWDARREPPAGWRSTGFVGAKAHCLEHIAEVWTDLRPLSARRGDTTITPGSER